MASPLGFRRRRLLATDTALLASSLDFLQGTFEKIQLHRLVNQHPLQLVDFLTERGLARAPWWRHLAGVEGIKLISPLVQKPPMHTKFLRQFHDVVAGLQTLDSHPAEFFWIPSHSSLRHLQCLSLQSVPYPSVSSEGFSPPYLLGQLLSKTCPIVVKPSLSCSTEFPQQSLPRRSTTMARP